MKFYIVKQFIKKVINSIYYNFKKIFNTTGQFIKFLITIFLILILIQSFIK